MLTHCALTITLCGGMIIIPTVQMRKPRDSVVEELVKLASDGVGFKPR